MKKNENFAELFNYTRNEKFMIDRIAELKYQKR